MEGYWRLRKYNKEEARWDGIVEMKGDDDCEGDFLYRWMWDNIPGFNIADYEVEGDRESVDMLGEDGTQYEWRFRPCRTFANELAALKEQGLSFGNCVEAFGEEESPFAKAAKGYRSVEVDEPTVISQSEGGAYVMAWVWVSNAEALPGESSGNQSGK